MAACNAIGALREGVTGVRLSMLFQLWRGAVCGSSGTALHSRMLGGARLRYKGDALVFCAYWEEQA